MKKMKGNPNHSVSRREFILSGWKILGIVALAEALWLSVSMWRSGTVRKNANSENLKAVGNISDIPPGTVMPFRSGLFYLVRQEDGGLMAISMICTHLGCTVNWVGNENVFQCPCHASEFNRQGNVLKTPATKALNYYKVVVENGQVLVDLGNLIVKRKFDTSVITYV